MLYFIKTPIYYIFGPWGSMGPSAHYPDRPYEPLLWTSSHGPICGTVYRCVKAFMGPKGLYIW